MADVPFVGAIQHRSGSLEAVLSNGARSCFTHLNPLFSLILFMKSFVRILALSAMGMAAFPSFGQTSTHAGHSHDHTLSQALGSPMSIMGEHVHKKGEWMLSYRYMFMDMDGMRAGNDGVSAQQVFASPYAVTPERMTMDMSMVGVMYSPTDRFTLMAMFQYKSLEMDHLINPAAGPLLALNGGSNRFTTRSEGFGDIVLSGLYELHGTDCFQLLAGLGLSLPTGSMGEQDIVPGPGGLIPRQLPAAMQLGSGTVDFLPSMTVTQHYDAWMLGAQARGVIRTNDGTHGYRFGNRFNLDLWGAWSPLRWFSVTAGVGYGYEGSLRGGQAGVATNVPFGAGIPSVPTAQSANYGGQRIDAILGLNFVIPQGMLRGNRLGIDLRLPMYQNLNGVQLETDYTLTAGWSWAF